MRKPEITKRDHREVAGPEHHLRNRGGKEGLHIESVEPEAQMDMVQGHQQNAHPAEHIDAGGTLWLERGERDTSIQDSSAARVAAWPNRSWCRYAMGGRSNELTTRTPLSNAAASTNRTLAQMYTLSGVSAAISALARGAGWPAEVFLVQQVLDLRQFWMRTMVETLV